MKEHLGLKENIGIIILHHMEACYLIEHPFDEDRSHCTCGANKGHYSRETHKWKNIVTTAGDVFYAQVISRDQSSTPAPTNTFNTLELANGATADAPVKANNRGNMNGSEIASTQKAESAGFPKVNDGDVDNTGSGVDILTWTFEYTAGDFNATGISDMWIGPTAMVASEPILNHADESTFPGSVTFNKAATDSLKVIINHDFTGV